MAERKKSLSGSEDDSFTTDATPIPLGLPEPEPELKPEALPSHASKTKIVSKTQKKKTRKTKCEDQVGFNQSFFKNGGFAGIFKGTNNITHTGQTYYTTIESANNIHIGPNMNITQTFGSKKTEKQSKLTEWEVPKEYFECKRPITYDIINEAKVLIGMRWTPLGRELGFCTGELENFHFDHDKAGLEEIVFHMIEEWHEREGKKATVGKFIEALWKTECRDTGPKFECWARGSCEKVPMEG